MELTNLVPCYKQPDDVVYRWKWMWPQTIVGGYFGYNNFRLAKSGLFFVRIVPYTIWWSEQGADRPVL